MKVISARFIKCIGKSKTNIAPIAVSGGDVNLISFYLPNDLFDFFRIVSRSFKGIVSLDRP
jgi:hypothetical protein